MALEPIVNQGASYQDSSRTTSRLNVRTVDAQSTETAQPIITGAGTQAATKVSTGGREGNANQQNNEPQANASMLKTAVDHANSKIKNTKTRCEFNYNENLNRVSIKVLDKETDEVIREIPPEETLEMIEKLLEVAGLLVDKKL